MSFCYISLINDRILWRERPRWPRWKSRIAGHDWTSARPPAGTGSRLRMSLAYTPRRRERGRTRTRPPPSSFTRTPVFVRLSLSADNRRCLLIGIATEGNLFLTVVWIFRVRREFCFKFVFLGDSRLEVFIVWFFNYTSRWCVEPWWKSDGTLDTSRLLYPPSSWWCWKTRPRIHWPPVSV